MLAGTVGDRTPDIYTIDPWAHDPRFELALAGPHCGRILAAALGGGHAIVLEGIPASGEPAAGQACNSSWGVQWRVRVIDLATRQVLRQLDGLQPTSA